MAESRTHKALKNSTLTLMCQLIYLITGFIGRTILANLLGPEYLGINGLFSNILTILSFAELGIGTTLVYRLYEPIAKGDKKKIAAYITLYKKIYLVIISVITALGLILIPFLRYIVEAPDVKEDLIVLYLLYLADTIITYSFVYKKAILTADQKQYIISIFTQLFNILMNILQCVVLLVTHSFFLYFAVKIVCDLMNNVVCSVYAQKKYPYITYKNTDTINKDEIAGLKKDVKGLLLTKVASTAFSGTDNIFISAFMGIGQVGILSNYTMLINIVNSIMNSIFDSITATIGNLNISGDIAETEKVLYRLYYVNASIYSYICIVMTLLIQEFVTKIWFTDEYFLPAAVIITAFIELFIRSLHFPIYTVRNSLGLFSQYKIFFAASAILNLILDAILIIPFGIAGLFTATILCRGITYVLDIKAVYKYGFDKSSLTYYKNLAKWIVFTLATGAISYMLTYLITIDGIAGFILRIFAITIVYAVSYIVVFGRNENIKYFTGLIKKVLPRRARK